MGGEDLDGGIDPERAPFADLMASNYGRPVAVTVEHAAELLAEPRRRVRAKAARLQPYIASDGSPRWSLRELAEALGKPKLTGQGSDWRRTGKVALRRRDSGQ